ncbi:MAG: formylglycine-generating enzyme family protein [bacterium]
MLRFTVFYRYLLLFSVLGVFLIAGCGNDRSQEIELRQITTKTGVEMVLIPSGEFVMGDEKGETDEKPERNIRITAFYMDKYEVTQEAYQNLIGKNPSNSKGPDKPVEQLSWYGAIKYCNIRSLREGLQPCYELDPLTCNFEANGYRLPTEAEWEYACRAGTTTEYSFGNDPRKLAKYAWFKGNANNATHPVGRLAPNPWGLYDMHGNVWEWCNDFYTDRYEELADNTDPRGPDSGDECVLRGGGWNSTEEYSRSATRHSEPLALADVCFGYDAYGFRCVRKSDEGSVSPEHRPLE